MTDDELDLLASAYVDGEATPEEVALVERDPELLARVEEFRALDIGPEPAVPPPGLAERHLAVAMAEFGVQADAGPAPVVDLRERRSARPARPPRGLPSWLPAAAAFILIGGGVVWALGRVGGGDDDAFDTAAVDQDAGSDESAEAATEEASDEGETMAESAAVADDAESSDDSADESMDATAAAPADEEAEERTESGDSDAADGGEPLATTVVTPPPPMAFYDEVPDPESIIDLPEPIADLGFSRCGPEVVTPGLGEAVGFVPVEVAGRPAEVFVFLQGDGTEVRLLVDESCEPLEP